MNEKKIYGVFRGAPFHMVGDGFRVSNYFPGGNRFGQMISPFFLLDYNPPHEFGATDTPRGVGVHPHRGFETVTIAFEGSVAHHDSYGHSGVIRPGDVQWMTAGSGVLHKEYHEKEFARQGGVFHMLQLWVNLPAKNKMTEPRYQTLTRDMLGKVKLPGEAGLVRVVAGEYQGIRGPAKTFSPIHLLLGDVRAGHQADFSFPASTNTGILITGGTGQVNGHTPVQAMDFVLFDNEGKDIRVTAQTDLSFVVFNGEPIREPVAHYGPFVMNTMQEIEEAFEDFREGKFGVLED
jgi:hypothetical protein